MVSKTLGVLRGIALIAVFFVFSEMTPCHIFWGRSCSAQEPNKNFATYQRDDPNARKILDRANECYDLIWRAWFREEPQPLPQPCLLTWKISDRPSGGVTSYQFAGGRVSGMEMHVSGRWDEVWNDTLPHECVHAVLANKLGFNLPRWLNEGAASTAESDNSITRHENMIVSALRNNRAFPTNQILTAKQYPDDFMTFYSQSVSLARFLLAKRGPDDFIRLARSHRQSNSWTQSFRAIYGYENIKALQDDWVQWVSNGSPDIHPDEDIFAALKPIPRAQAPYRPTDQLQADLQLQQQAAQQLAAMQNCSPTAPSQQPINQQPTTQPGQIRVEVDYQKLAQELAKIPELRGPAGPAGSNGKNAELTQQELQKIADLTVGILGPQLAAQIEAVGCKCNTDSPSLPTDGPDDTVSSQPPVPHSKPDTGDPSANNPGSGDCSCTDEQLQKIAERVAAQVKADIVASLPEIMPDTEVYLVDGITKKIIDHEAYPFGKPIVLDFQKVLNAVRQQQQQQ